MKQGLLAFQYEEEKSTTGMTALSGLMTYVELMHVAGLRSSVERRVGLGGGGQGWTDSQIITSLILLNLAGGESVMDLEVLEKDAGLCRVLRHAETHGMRRRERRALKARWRGERWRSVPSDSVVFRYLERFHDAGEEAKREAYRAVRLIPRPRWTWTPAWWRATRRRRCTATRSTGRISGSRPTGQRPTWWCTRSFETATCLRAISSFEC